MSDKIAVFLNGKIVEYADADLLFKDPKKEYTKSSFKISNKLKIYIR